MSQTADPNETAAWRERLRIISAQLNALRTIREPPCTSRVPIVGPLLVAIRRLWHELATRWVVQPILEQQNRFNEAVVRALDELAAMGIRTSQHLDGSPSRGTGKTNPSRANGFGFTGAEGEERLGEMDAAALLAWENAAVPALERHSEALEARADELLDEEVCLNYPLHWRAWRESWPYLFDLALASEMLGCRPGDLVLDCAAGTCWAGEFLGRLGISVVSLDLSVEMLRRGRRRLAADQRAVGRTGAGFTAGSALHLPFADGTFDGVLCMNALHHLPSYRQALQEIYRVLKDGGRAAFSEPGAAHGQAPISQTRMRELGVLEKSVSLPLIRRLAGEVGFSRMQVVPLRDPVSYPFEYTATPADWQALEQMWEQTLQFSPHERARFVLQKEDPPPADSLMPPSLLLHHVLRARIQLVRTQAQVQPGAWFTDRIAAQNQGDVIWRAQGRGFGGHVTCGVKLCTQDGQVLRDDLGRPALAHDVAPGEAIEVELRLQAPLEPGRYLLKYDMLVEAVAWFEACGSEAVQRILDVRP